MQLAAFTCVRDERDIIEPFVRHTLQFASHLFIIDHGSTDGTSGILEALRDEGLAIDICRDDTLGNHQANRMTALLYRAVRATQADWFLPLDADEFVRWSPGYDLPATDRPIALRWQGYVPDDADDAAEVNPVLRVRRRRDIPLWEDSKVLIPRSLACQPGVRLRQGSHGVTLNGVEQDAVAQSGIALAHFPIRSAQQHLAKLTIRALQYELVLGRNPTFGWRAAQLLQEAQRNASVVAGQFADEARRYGLAESAPNEFPMVDDLIDYRGGPLRYTTRPENTFAAFQSLLALATQVVREKNPPPPTVEVATASDRERLLRDQSVAIRLLEQRIRELESEVGAARETASPVTRPISELETRLQSSWTWRVRRQLVGAAAFARRQVGRLGSFVAHSPLIRSINCLSRPRLRRSK